MVKLVAFQEEEFPWQSRPYIRSSLTITLDHILKSQNSQKSEHDAGNKKQPPHLGSVLPPCYFGAKPNLAHIAMISFQCWKGQMQLKKRCKYNGDD